jgi:hypothetical protein
LYILWTSYAPLQQFLWREDGKGGGVYVGRDFRIGNDIGLSFKELRGNSCSFIFLSNTFSFFAKDLFKPIMD